MHASHFFGCIGQMLPAAMGAVVATGNKPRCWSTATRACMMHLSEFDTVVRYKMPLLIVVMNDEALGSEYHKLNAHKMEPELSCIPTPDIGAVARATAGAAVWRRTLEDEKKADRGMGRKARSDDDRRADLAQRHRLCRTGASTTARTSKVR